MGAQRAKARLYEPWMQTRRSGLFTPLAAETYGCLAPLFVSFLRRAGSAHARRLAGLDSADPPEEAMSHLFLQRISLQLQRAQAQEFRRILTERGGEDETLAEDQLELARLWDEAAVEAAPTLDDAALVELD